VQHNSFTAKIAKERKEKPHREERHAREGRHLRRDTKAAESAKETTIESTPRTNAKTTPSMGMVRNGATAESNHSLAPCRGERSEGPGWGEGSSYTCVAVVT